MLRLFMFIAALSHFSCGQQPELLLAFDSLHTRRITMECIDDFIEAAHFTFRNPDTETVERRIQTTTNQPAYTTHILPENETIVSCRIDGASEESERVMIAAAPEHSNARTIMQYFYSDTDTIELQCPFEYGRLHGRISPYTISWQLHQERDRWETPIVNGTNHGKFYLSADGKTLYAHLPLPSDVHSYQCRTQVKRCNSTTEFNSIVCVSVTESGPYIVPRIIDLVNITNPPSNTTVNQHEVANFSCTATGGGALSIEWEVDGVTHSERCTGGPITVCSSVVNETSITSTLKFNLNQNVHREQVTSLKIIICIVNQTLPTDETTEVQLPTVVTRTKRSIPVHLLIIQEYTATALVVVTNTFSTTLALTLFSNVSQDDTILYTMFGAMCALLITSIIATLSCTFGIVFYAKKRNSLVLNRETESSGIILHNSQISQLPLPLQVSRMDNRSQNVEISTLTANVAYGTGSSEIDVIKNVAYQPTTLNDDSTLLTESHLIDETAT